jgi:hypothetical protein
MFCTTDAFPEPGSMVKIMKDYHTTLPAAMKAAYPFEHLVEDVKLTSVTFAVGCVALMAGQIAGYADMPEDKRNYTWQVFWPKAFERCINFYDQLDAYEFTLKIASQ